MYQNDQVLVAKEFGRNKIFRFSGFKFIHDGNDLINTYGLQVVVPNNDDSFALQSQYVRIVDDSRDNFVDSYYVRPAYDEEIEFYEKCEELFDLKFS